MSEEESLERLAKRLRVWEADKSSMEIESTLEFLHDCNLLTERGEKMRDKFYEIFIEEEEGSEDAE